MKRAYRILDTAMNLKANADGLRNRSQAARYWEALTQSRPPEDAPAFDAGRSSRSVIEEIMDENGAFADGAGGPRGGAPAPAAQAMPDADTGPDDDGDLGGGAPADPPPAPKPVRPRGGAAGKGARHLPPPVPWPGQTTPEPDYGEDDLDALVRDLDLRMTGGRKGDE